MGVHSCPSLLIILHRKYEERIVFIFLCGIKVKIMNSDFCYEKKAGAKTQRIKQKADMSIQD